MKFWSNLLTPHEMRGRLPTPSNPTMTLSRMSIRILAPHNNNNYTPQFKNDNFHTLQTLQFREYQHLSSKKSNPHINIFSIFSIPFIAVPYVGPFE